MDWSEKILELIGQIYDSAADPALWSRFLESLSREFSASSILYLWDTKSHRFGFEINVGYEHDFIQAYNDYYGRVDIRVQEGLKRPPGLVHSDQMLLRDEVYLRSEIHNDYFGPKGFRHALGARISAYEDTWQAIIAINRPERFGLFDEEDVEFCQTLMPHMQRALQLYRQFSQLKAKGDAAVDALNWLPMGVVLLDGQGKVILMNQAAEEIHRPGDGLSVNGGRLLAGRPKETSTLSGLIHQTAQTGNACGIHPGGVMTVSRPSGLRDYAVLVAPLRSEAMGWAHLGASAVVFVSDPEREHELPEGMATRLYGLTPAEERLLGDLLRGQSLNEISDMRGVSLNTLRWQLKNIFRKTDTKRQSELLKLVLTGPANLRAPFNQPGRPFKLIDS